MQEQPTIEQRVSTLEDRVRQLERERAMQDDRDMALLARTDGALESIHRVERVQIRAFETLAAGQRNTEAALAVIADALKDHKASIETLASQVSGLEAGLRQVIMLLTGQAPRND
jgi:hypothetical protein